MRKKYLSKRGTSLTLFTLLIFILPTYTALQADSKKVGNHKAISVTQGNTGQSQSRASAKDQSDSKVPTIELLNGGISEGDVEKRPYLEYVIECVDNLIRYGTDRYGNKTLPLLVTYLDVRSRSCPEDPPAQTAPWRG